MKILINSWNKFLFSHIGDYSANKDLLLLGNQLLQHKFYSVDSFKASIFANLRALILHLCYKMRIFRFDFKFLQPLFNLQCISYLPKSVISAINPEVILAHSHIPWLRLPDNIRLIAIEYLPSPRYLRLAGLSATESMDISAKLFAVSRADAIVTTTQGSFDRFLFHKPDILNKLYLAPIYMPNIESIDIKHIIAKHKIYDRINILFVGGDAKRKGLEIIVAAFKLLNPNILKKINFVVVSNFTDGIVCGVEDVAVIKSQISQDDLDNEFRSAHIFIFPTLYETYGKVIVEAMAYGCAVISSNQDPQDWILDYGRAGIIISPDSSTELADTLTDLVYNNNKRLTTAVMGNRRFNNVFHHSVVGSIYNKIFNEVSA